MAIIDEKYKLLTTDEVTEYLQISKPTLLKYLHTGRIRAVKVGKGWRIFHSELIRFLSGEDPAKSEEVRSRGALKNEHDDV